MQNSIELPCQIGDRFWSVAYRGDDIIQTECVGFTINIDGPLKIDERFVWIGNANNVRDYWKIPFVQFENQCFKNKEDLLKAMED